MHRNLVALLLALLLALLFALACRAKPVSAPIELVGDASPSSSALPAPPLSIVVEPDGSGVAEPLLFALASATVAVHVEMYLLTNDTYVRALETAYSNGIDVEVVLNQTFPGGTSSDNTNESSYATLSAAGVPVTWAPTDTGFDSYTHEKAVIIDPGTANAQVWIMTMNLDYAGPTSNREYLAKDTDPDDVNEAETIFAADFAGESVTPSGALVVAPSPANDAVASIVSLIASATTSIDLEAEELDSAGLAGQVVGALTTASANGVAVRVVLEDSSSEEQASAVRGLVAAGASVVGYAYGDGLDIHAKAIVVDTARAYVGSENITGGSLGYNRELGVIFSDPASVSAVDNAILDDFEAGSSYEAD